MLRTCALTLSFVSVTALVTAQDSLDDSTRALIARAASFELKTQSLPPPGDPLEHHASGFAKILCSAVFVSGLDPEFAAENVGYFTAPYEERANMTWRVDRENRAVHVTLPSGLTRTAKFIGDLGCLTLPPGKESPFFEPPKIESSLPDAATMPWPMGDVLPSDGLPADLDATLVAKAVDAAFQPQDALTAAYVVTWKGRIIGERYGDGITMHTPLESWSMGKSLTATLLGTLVNDGVYSLDQPAPIPQWQNENDPRKEIRIADILHMSSGLRFRAPLDPDFDPADGYPDHRYVYTGAINSFHWAANRPLQWPPNTVGRYRNSDPVLANYLIRLAVENRGLDYHSFPQRALFDKLGMRNMVLETDPYGNFLLQGYEYGSARDWSRLGNLYLQRGLWNGQRLLPEEFVDFVSTLAPAWVADGRPIYGGFFWINGNERFPIPEEAYYMAGAGGQYTIIIPSHDLVVVRLGHYKGSDAGLEALGKSLSLLMQAVPGRQNEPAKGSTKNVDLGGNATLELVYIPAGEFKMGSTPAERAWATGIEGGATPGTVRESYEGPQPRLMRVKDGFWMGRTEVSVGQFRQFVEDSGYVTDAEKPGGATHCFDPEWKITAKAPPHPWKSMDDKSWRDPNFGFPLRSVYPVVCVSWNDGRAFCEWLTEKEREAGRLPDKFEYRLPTEAEWAYACRGGRESTYFWWGNDLRDGEGRLNISAVDFLPGRNKIWPLANAPWSDGFAFVSPVDHYGEKGRNGFGLADMCGGVWEIVLDHFDPEGGHEEAYFVATNPKPVCRGGNYFDVPGNARCAVRLGLASANYSDSRDGFRICLGVPRGNELTKVLITEK